MAVSHIFSNAIADFTGTITGFNSQGSTTTIIATNIVRPSDWNSAHNQFYTLTGNTTGNSTASGTNVIFAGSGPISIGGSTNSIIISAPNAITHKMFAPFDEAVGVVGANQGSLHIYPIALPHLQHDRIGHRIVHSNTTGSSGSVTLSIRCGLYTRNVSTLSLLSSTSSSWAFTNSGTQGIYSSIGGQRLATIPWSNTITEGDYWMGIVSQTATAGTSCSFSQVMASQINSDFSGIFNVASNATAQRRLGFGFYSVTTAAMPASIAFSEIQGTASIAHRPPMWMLLSQTA